MTALFFVFFKAVRDIRHLTSQQVETWTLRRKAGLCHLSLRSFESSGIQHLHTLGSGSELW